MASVSLKHVYKVYDGKVKAVNDFNMDIEDKEFIVFVGPSGCGKSTTLRMIAGLESITAGDLFIDGVLVNDVEPKDRDIAMVFQNYAIYPHMTVYENMAFGLKIMKLPKDEIDRKVREAARILGIEEYLSRLPKALSGGQRQRVALGREIVRQTKVFLLDEPLSNLDAKLRTAMRTEITKLHKKLGTTFIYVTHDQIEAMTMGQRIVVMKDGYVQQIDTPQNVFKYPGNKFVAGFIGTPQMNFYEAELRREGKEAEITFMGKTIRVPYAKLIKVDPEYFDGRKVIIGLRPQALSIDAEEVEKNPQTVIDGVVQLIENLGSESNLFVDLDYKGNDDNISESETNITVRVEGESKVKPGETVKFAVNADEIHLFDKDSEVTIKPRIPEYNKAEAEYRDKVLKIYGESVPMPRAISEKLGKREGGMKVYIPSRGVKICDGGIRAKVIDNELIGKERLLTLLINEYPVFAVTKPEEDFEGEVGVEFDMKQIEIKDGTETVAKPLKQNNTLSGGFEEKKAKGVKTYYYKVGENRLAVDAGIAKRFLSFVGKKIYSTPLTFVFSPYKVKGNGEFSAEYKETLDYGKEKFDAYIVDGTIVYTSDIGEQKYTSLSVAEEDIGVVDAKLDIKLI